MAASKLSIYNGALRLLGERRTTLTEDRASRRYLDDAWDDGLIDTVLEHGYWKFATRTVKLNASTSVTPNDFGYRYAFEQPDDYIKLASISADEYFQQTLNQYSDERGFWWMDIDTVYVKYISNDDSYGMNFALWPRSFEKFAQAELADEVKELVTGNDGKYERIKMAKKDAKIDARSKDAMNSPVKFQQAGSWVKARMTSTVNSDG